MDDIVGLLFGNQECEKALENSNLEVNCLERAKSKLNKRRHCCTTDITPSARYRAAHVTFPVWLAIKASLGRTLALTRVADRLYEREGQRSYSLVPVLGSGR
jgi:hypothetical protein